MTTFTTNALALAELRLDKPIGAIVAEANSEQGLSLFTLKALAAALKYRNGFAGMPLEIHRIQFDGVMDHAGADIDERGAAVVGAEVGKALGDFIESVLEVRS